MKTPFGDNTEAGDAAMATKQSKNKNALIKCEHCGEYYSATYKECPFCDEYDADLFDEYEEEAAPRRRSGGKRLVTNTRGGGYGRGWTPARILVTVLSLAVIIAAFCIVFTVIRPLIDRGKIDPTAPPVSESVSPSADPAPTPSEDVPSTDPEPTPSQIPSDQTATGFTLSKSEFAFSDRYPDPITLKVTFSPAGSTGYITWTSSDPDVVSVDETGKVSHGSKKGTATITATMAGGVTRTCTVYNQVTGGTAPTPIPSAAPSAGSTSLSLNKTDFTFSSPNEPAVKMKVNGTSSTPTWSMKNTAVASITSDGVVTPVGRGTTKILCTVDGQTLECIVRVTFG